MDFTRQSYLCKPGRCEWVGVVTAVGAVIGLALSAAGAIVLRSLFESFTVMDPVVPLIVCTRPAAVALTAGILPARRDARVDPRAALRPE